MFDPLMNLQDAHFWVTMALVVFIFILWRAKVFPMIGATLDKERHRVQAQLDEAAALRAEAQAMLDQVNIRRAETERAAAEMLAAAEADAGRMREEAQTALEEQIRRRGQMAERQIALAEAQAASQVKAAAADLAAQAAELVLAARVGKSKSDVLVDQALQGLSTRFS
ncbi:MAG TPA: ATP F0F1 synthase subunit B [Caulobacteraceae bacterium]|jgi:F-type H+-transporting ATPase subunit b|nr:ATP F0F1 synthase subunit B [Caulobacteraceae bacterium]